ncbi:MAG: heme anaerobic degradation radical SAM methyltransferase ChuW/HutW [Paracoccus sp. (in: a-proteobacteria)]
MTKPAPNPFSAAAALQGAGADEITIESLFATIGSDPLADAFPGKRAVHPFTGMSPVPPPQVPSLWDQVHASPRTRQAVAYIHIPFCENHCHFCGFYQNAWREDAGASYVDAVIAQLKDFVQRPVCEGPPLLAVYMGGGTPTALAGPDIARLVRAVRENLPLAPDCEITLEGRVISFDTEKALAAFDAGVTRVSLGVQSFSDRLRRPLGRKAGRNEIIALLEKLVGLDRGAIVVDLISGLPDQKPDDIADDVRLCAALGLDGLDLYSLNLIPGTPLLTAVEKGKKQIAGAHEQGAYFTAGEESAEAEGWTQISTTHWQGSLRERNAYNLSIKTGADCLPFGAGAGGFLGGYNYRITSDLGGFTQRAGDGSCLTEGMMRQGPLTGLANAIKAGMERGSYDPARVQTAFDQLCPNPGLGINDHLDPLLGQWTQAGLFTPRHRFYRLTRAGRFWQVAMTGRLIRWLDQHPDLKELT